MLRKLSNLRGKKQLLVKESVIAARFALVGVAATTIHIFVVAVLVSQTALPVLLANTAAFLTAFGISFVANYVWTFGTPGSPRKAIRRFIVVSASLFALNTVVLTVFVESGSLSPFYSAIAAATVIPLVSFISNRLWVFRDERESFTIKKQ
jgi:putative flippase GtrA